MSVVSSICQWATVSVWTVRDVTTLRYYNVDGDEAETTWDQARAGLIVEGLPVRIPPSYRGQGSYPGLFWAATNDRMLVSRADNGK